MAWLGDVFYATGTAVAGDGYWADVVAEIRYRLLSALEQAEQTPDQQRCQFLQSVVQIRGGPSGCDLAGSLSQPALSRAGLYHPYTANAASSFWRCFCRNAAGLSMRMPAPKRTASCVCAHPAPWFSGVDPAPPERCGCRPGSLVLAGGGLRR
jgi:hypothetical protein